MLQCVQGKKLLDKNPQCIPKSHKCARNVIMKMKTTNNLISKLFNPPSTSSTSRGVARGGCRGVLHPPQSSPFGKIRIYIGKFRQTVGEISGCSCRTLLCFMLRNQKENKRANFIGLKYWHEVLQNELSISQAQCFDA